MTNKPVEPIVEENKPISILETIKRIVRKVRKEEKYK